MLTPHSASIHIVKGSAGAPGKSIPQISIHYPSVIASRHFNTQSQEIYACILTHEYTGLSMYVSTYVSMCLCMCLSIYVSVYVCMYHEFVLIPLILVQHHRVLFGLPSLLICNFFLSQRNYIFSPHIHIKQVTNQMTAFMYSFCFQTYSVQSRYHLKNFLGQFFSCLPLSACLCCKFVIELYLLVSVCIPFMGFCQILLGFYFYLYIF